METPVKERLVGAVVLVGLIVALVPEMLSGPRRGGASHSASADGAVRTFTIDLAPVTATQVAEPGDDAAVPEPLPSSPPVEPSEPRTQPSPAAQPDTSPPTVVTARPNTSKPSTDTGWAVQLGSFASRENADRLAADIRRSGYRAFVSRYEAGRSVRYRVRVGPEQDRAQAEALAQRLQRDGRQVSIVSHP
jgi:DedD protein